MVKKILKWTGITLGVLIIVIIALPFIFKGKIISTIKEEANNNLNAKVDFGDFDITLLSSFPNFTFSIDDVKLVGVREFEGDTLANIKNLTLKLNLMSVINGNYNIRSIEIESPRILAKVLKDGKANWDIAKADSAATPEQPAEESAPFKLSLKKFKITNGYIVYDDASMDFKMVLNGFNHELSGDFTSDNFTLETLTGIEKMYMSYGGVAYFNNVKTDIKADLDADMPNFKFTFKENEISLNELHLGVDGWFAMPKEDMDMDLKFSAKQTEFKTILSMIPAVYTKDFSTVKTAGKLALDGYAKGIYNDKQMPAFGVNLKIDDAMFQYPSLPKAVNNIFVDLKVDNKTGNPDNTIIDLKKFHMEMAGNPFDMKMHVETPVSDAYMNGEILGKIDLASVRDVVPLEKDDNLNGKITADVKIDGHMSSIEKEKYDEFKASGQLIIMDMLYKSKANPYDVLINKMYLGFTPKYVELTQFDSKIGKSDFQADGKIENFMQYVFKDSLLQGVFNLRSNLMDLNEFMTSSTADSSAAVADTSEMAVVEVPGNIDFTMTSKIGKIIYDNMEITDISGLVKIKDNAIDMSHLKMKMLNGGMDLSGRYDTKNIKSPKMDFDMDISNFDIPLTVKTFNTVEKLAAVGKYTTGSFSTKLKLKTELDSKMDPVYSTMNGEGNLKTNKVMVKDFGPMKKLGDVLKSDKFRELNLSDLNISYRIKDGRVYTEPYNIKMGNITAQMGGSSGIDQTIDYTMNMVIPRSEFGGAANAALDGLLAKANSKGGNLSLGDKVNIKALFGGTVTDPTVKTDLLGSKEDMKTQVQDLINQEKDKLIDQGKEKAKAEADKILADAQVQADKIKAEAAALAEKTKTEGYAAIDKNVESIKNPIQKMAAKAAAPAAKKEVDKQAQKIVDEANKKADALMLDAKAKADAKLQ